MMLNWNDMKHSAVPREMRVLVFGMLFGSEVVAVVPQHGGQVVRGARRRRAAGFLMGVGFMTNFEIEEEVHMRWFCRFCFAFFVVLGVIWHRQGPAGAAEHVGLRRQEQDPGCFQMFDCDIERSYKCHYNVFDCHRVLEDDKNSYQYRLKSKDPASAFAGQKNPFQARARPRRDRERVRLGFMKQVTGSSCADDRDISRTEALRPA